MSTSYENLLDREALSPFSYRHIADQPDFEVALGDADTARDSKKSGPSPEEIESRLNQARAEAASQTEHRMRKLHEEELASFSAQIQRAVEEFTRERQSYFSRVETEVVRLALSIAARILHREAQVDPMLVASLVRIAIEKMQEGSRVTLRVTPADAANWRALLGQSINGCDLEIIEDQELCSQKCILETRLGSAEFSIEAQLREIERGFFDLLAHRPDIK